jgi:hypothetical protein
VSVSAPEVEQLAPKLMELDPLPDPPPVPPPVPLPEPELFDDCGRHEDFPSLPSVQYIVTPAVVTPVFGPFASQRIPSVTAEEFDGELELDVCGEDVCDEEGEVFEVLLVETLTPLDQTNFFPDLMQVYS